MRFLRPFFFGIIASLGAFLSEFLLVILFGISQEAQAIPFDRMTLFLAAAVLVEEIFKLIFVYKNYRELGSGSPGINLTKEVFFSSLAIGAGFALFESSLVLSEFAGWPVSYGAPFPVAGIFLVHLATTAIMGHMLSKSGSVKFYLSAKALLISFALHMIYNSLMIYPAASWIIFSYILVLAGAMSAATAGIILQRQKKPEA